MNPTVHVSEDDDDTPPEFDFTRAEMGKFYHPNAKLSIPLYLPQEMMDVLLELSGRKKVCLSTLTDDLMKYGFARVMAENGQGGVAHT